MKWWHMATLIPEHIKKLKSYQAGKTISQLKREKNLKNVTKLASNENPLGPSPIAIKNMTGQLWGVHHYPEMSSYDLKEKLSQVYNLSHQNIILGNGSEGILAYIMKVFVQKNDQVLTSEGTFVGFYVCAGTCGAKITTVPLRQDYRFDLKEMASQITPNTRLIYVANPNNPTGTYVTKTEFDSFMEKVPKDIVVVLDEAYFEFAVEHFSYPNSMSYRHDNVITLRTFSKAYGLAGIRIGYGFGHHELIESLHKVKLPFEPNIIAQQGAIGALEDHWHLERTLNNNRKRYNELTNYFKDKKFKYIPSVTNFVCLYTGSKEATLFLYKSLEDFGVITRTLFPNGIEDYLRISIGTKAENYHLINSIENTLPEMRKRFPEFGRKQ